MNWWRRAFISEEDLDISGQSSTDCISLVIYDITDDKRRGKLFTTLKKYGVQVQKSAFECRISEEKNKLMLKQLTSIINEKYDLLRVYRLSRNYNIQCWGSVGKLDEDDGFWVI
ncbi:MAG TPA: CRISPR-associated endonuclease Cas2 [Clostridiaceae bacterium]|nr:CRISPR-associated endonuclease Cas2 [Clostridiaceae bacterium]